MTIKELIERLSNIKDKNKIVIIYDGYGWANIEKLEETDIVLRIREEENPLFSE